MIASTQSVLHAPVLAAIHARSFAPEAAWDAAAFAALLNLPGSFACIDGAGAFVLARVAADEAEVLTLAVAPSLRRAGRGLALVRAAMDEAAAAGACSIFLEVARGNDAARGLYARAGFAQVGVRRDYYGIGADALVLRRELAARPTTIHSRDASDKP